CRDRKVAGLRARAPARVRTLSRRHRVRLSSGRRAQWPRCGRAHPARARHRSPRDDRQRGYSPEVPAGHPGIGLTLPAQAGYARTAAGGAAITRGRGQEALGIVRSMRALLADLILVLHFAIAAFIVAGLAFTWLGAALGW